MKKTLLLLLTISLIFSLISPVKAQFQVLKIEKEQNVIEQILRLLLILLAKKFGIQISEIPSQPLTTPEPKLKPETPSPEEESQQLAEAPECNYQHFYDFVIYGGSEAGVAAAIQARRVNPNIRVAIIEDTDWLGGQLSSQAVTTYDAFPKQYSLDLTHEISEAIENYYTTRGWPKGYSYSPEPYVGKMVVENLLNDVGGIDVYYRHELVQADYTNNEIKKIITKDSNQQYHCFSGNLFLEASGWGDLLLALPNSYQTPIGEPNPVKTDGTPDPENAGCLQKLTYSMMIKKYPNEVPSDISLINKPVPETADVPFTYQEPRRVHRDNENHSWEVAGDFFNAFIDLFTGGYRTTPCTTSNCPANPYSRGGLLTQSHRILAQPTKTGMNMGPEDYPLTEADFLNKNQRKETICRAKLKTIQLLWWINNVVPDYWQSASNPNFPIKWGIEKEEGFDTDYNRWQNFCDYQLTNPAVASVVNEIQKYMPVEPYLREGVRLKGLQTLTFEDVGGYNIFRQNNEPKILKAKFDDEIGFAYAFDFHGCISPKVKNQRNKINTHYFGIPAKSLISLNYDNLLASGLNISVDRVINAATRLTAHSIVTGEAAGVLAGVSLELNKKPKEIVNNKPYLRYYQNKLIDLGVAPFYFPDVKIPNAPNGTPFFQFIQKAVANKIFAGYADGKFRPKESINRAQFAIIIKRLFQELGYDTSVPACDPNNLTFLDVPCEASYWDEVEFMYRQGITAGCAQRYYCPDRPLTKAQAVLMLDKVIHQIDSTRDASSIVYQFRDVNNNLILHAINTMIQNGAPVNLIQCSENLFCPNQLATREFLAMLTTITYGNPLTISSQSSMSSNNPTQSENNTSSIISNNKTQTSQTKYCLMVITPARNQQTKECKLFPNSCLPEGWFPDRTCAPYFY